MKKLNIPKWAMSPRIPCGTRYYIEDNPPSAFRQMWRRKARAKQKAAMQKSHSFDDLIIEMKIAKLTSEYDWY